MKKYDAEVSGVFFFSLLFLNKVEEKSINMTLSTQLIIYSVMIIIKYMVKKCCGAVKGERIQRKLTPKMSELANLGC